MKAIRILIFAVCYFSPWLPLVSSIEESFCVGVGYDDKRLQGLGLKSMGSTRLYSHPLNTFWAATHMEAKVNWTGSSDGLKLKIGEVRGPAADGVIGTLNGWLLIEIASKTKYPFAAVAIWALTDKLETFGQFVSISKPSLNCGEGDWDTKWFSPCSGTPVDSPLNPNMFIYTNRKVGSTDASGIALLWRADMTYCNKPQYFIFVIAVTGKQWATYPKKVSAFAVHEGRSKKLGPFLFRSPELHPEFYGAASPIFNRKELECNGVDIIPDIWPSWIRPSSETSVLCTLDSSYHDDRWSAQGVEQIDVVNRRSVCKAKLDGFVDFGGRCSEQNSIATQKGTRVWASIKSPPKCNFDSNAFESTDFQSKFEGSGSVKHYEYITRERKRQVHKKPCDCPPVPISTEVSQVSSVARELSWTDSHPYMEPEKGCKKFAGAPEYHVQGLCVNSAAGLYSLGVRQWHGIANLFCCMVFIPTSCFVARYLKGHIPIAHDTGQSHLPINHWYMVHIFLVLPVICLYTSGMAAIRRQLAILGPSRSEYAKFHNVGGILTMTFFAFQCFSGFLRPLNMFWRKTNICLHWGCGYFTYYFGAIVCILTYRIPGSPFSFQSHLSKKFNDVGSHPAAIIVLTWLILDVVIHISVTIFVVHYDKAQLGVNKLSYFPVFLPLPVDSYYLRTHDYSELPQENKYLVRMSVCYCVLCVTFFCVTLMAMTYLNFEINEHGFGPMECTHSRNNTFVASVDVTDEELKEKQQFCLSN